MSFIYYICTIVFKFIVIKKLIYPFIIALLVSCSSSSSLVGVNIELHEKTTSSQSFTVEEKVQFINSYISNMDVKAGDINNFNVDELKINGDERIITENESKKDILLKNNSIVRVKYMDHLHNNFMKSKIFYYNKNELICIKIIKILPDQFNKIGVYQRTIYIHDNQPICDSDLSSSDMKEDDYNNLVVFGQESLKNEYSSLN